MKNTYIDEKGYRRFNGSNELVHRWAAEKKLGRKLRNGEVVHHKDRNKLNNNPDNLYVCKNQVEHDRIHEFDRKRFGPKASYQGFGKKRAKNSGCMLNLASIIMLLVICLYLLN